MRRIDTYLFSRTAKTALAILLVLTAIVWVTQALRRFELVTAKGQAIVTYLGMTLLAVPSLMTIVAPFALAIAMVVVLDAMHADSELVAIDAAGSPPRRTLRPFLVLGVATGVLVAWIGAYAAPASLQLLRDYTSAVRADILANVVQPGRFVEVDDNFIFHIRDRAGDGSLRGLFIFDTRDPELTFTYTAERGRFIEAMDRTLMIMETGTIERRKAGSSSTTFVAFGSYAFDLTSLKQADTTTVYQANERSLSELLALPADDAWRMRNESRIAQEIQNRLSAVLYPPAMVLAVFLFLGFARTTRQSRWSAVLAAIVAATLVRVAGFGAAGLAANDGVFLPLVWIVPLAVILGAGAAIAADKPPRFEAGARLAVLAEALRRRVGSAPSP